jgi:hypothetical protein
LLQGTAVNASGGTFNVNGGSSSTGVNGGGGRVLFGTNTSSPLGGTINGASVTVNNIGTRDANPFVGGSPNTPFIPKLNDGTTTSAEIYGRTDGTMTSSAVAAAMGGSLPQYGNNGVPLSQASLAVVRVHSVPGTSYSQDFKGFDYLVALNLSAGPISNISFGSDGADQSLLFRGYTRDPAVGGSGGRSAGQRGLCDAGAHR